MVLEGAVPQWQGSHGRLHGSSACSWDLFHGVDQKTESWVGMRLAIAYDAHSPETPALLPLARPHSLKVP